jgi:BirA family biotin operon repressor/biotin-[acetyl-CoA-carboxylase] ligase
MLVWIPIMRKGRVLVLDKVTSTQDAAIEHDLQVGDVCISFNQTAGRGRHGNTWIGKGGVAVTVVLESATMHLPIAVAATLAARLNSLVPLSTIGIKWPNDLFVDSKKLAGVLIEQRKGKCLVGVGVNVLESPLPTSIALNEIGAETDVETVADVVSTSILDASQLDENTAVTSWRRRDILVGTQQMVKSGENIVEGLILAIDPCHNLIVQTKEGILELPASTSTFVTNC